MYAIGLLFSSEHTESIIFIVTGRYNILSKLYRSKSGNNVDVGNTWSQSHTMEKK